MGSCLLSGFGARGGPLPANQDCCIHPACQRSEDWPSLMSDMGFTSSKGNSQFHFKGSVSGKFTNSQLGSRTVESCRNSFFLMPLVCLQ